MLQLQKCCNYVIGSCESTVGVVCYGIITCITVAGHTGNRLFVFYSSISEHMRGVGLMPN